MITETDTFRNASGPVSVRLTNDYFFKTLLQRNDAVLKSLICSLLHLSQEQVADAMIINPIMPGDKITEKRIMMDVNIVFNNGSRLALEMQVVNEHNWPERSVYYACRNFTDLNQGEDYTEVKPAIQIGFLDYTLFPEHPCFYQTFKFLEINDGHVLTDKFSIGVVDLTNINLATEEDRLYNIDKWAKLFKSKTWEEVKMMAEQDTGISAAAATIYRLSEDERIRQECEAREDYLKRERGMEKIIEKQKKKIDEKDRELGEKNKELEDKNKELEEKNKEIEQLKALLAAKDQ